MKFFITAVAAAGALAAAGAVSAATAHADAGDVAPSTHPIGTQGTVENGGVIQGWTVSDLRPSSDAIPYHPQGTLWEATATDVAIAGSVTPVIANLGARSASGATYPALFTVATAQGVNPANLTQGQKTSGKVYFDVTGDSPNSAVYQGAGKDLLVWTPAAPVAPAGGSSVPATAGSPRPAAPSATGPKPGDAGTHGAPAATESTPASAGSQGTPLSSSSQGTPLPAEANGTPATTNGSEATATPGSSETAAAAGSPQPSTSAGSAESSTSASGAGGSAQQLPGAPAEPAAAAGSSGTPLPEPASGASDGSTAVASGTGATGSH